MTQKQLFNQLLTPNMEVPVLGVTGNPFFFHRLQADTDNPDRLWALHLWVNTNGWVVASDAAISVIAVPIGDSPFGPNVSVIAGLAFVTLNSVVVNNVFKIADKLPLRGPMDLYIIGAGGDASGNLFNPGAFGYMVRGNANSVEERRFFNISAPIDDQVTAFAGGQATVLSVDDLAVPLHNTDPNYLDEITVDVAVDDPALFLPSISFSFPSSPVPVVVTLDGNGVILGSRPTVRVFDGFPVRNAGILSATSIQIEAAGQSSIVTGHFVRS